MNIDNNDKALLLNGGAATLSNIRLLDDEGQEFLINDDNYLAEWNYEDYRYVPENGFIGQFVERIFDGRLLDLPTDMSLEGKEIKPSLGVQDIQNSTTKYYDIGTFIVTDIGEKDKTGSYKFKSSDYTKKFNILYKDFGKYPCLSIELLNSVCEQVGVPYDNNGMCWCYAVTEDGVEAGPHCFEIDGTYYNFTLDNDLSLNDSLMYIEATNKLIQKRVIVEGNEYKVIRTEISFQTTSSSTVHQLLGSYIPYYDFTNNDFVIINNQFDEDELCRDVVKAVAKLAYTWARIGTDDKLHLDFTKKNAQDVDEYDIINTDRYYDNVTTGDTLIPINKVLIGMSQVDGENVYSSFDADKIHLTKLNGETSQETGHGYQMLMNTNVNNGYNYWNSYSTYDKETRTLTRSTTSTSESFINHVLNGVIENNTTYTLSCWVKQNGKVVGAEIYLYGTTGGAVGVRHVTYTDIGTSWVKKTWTFTTDASANYNTAYLRFDNNGSTTSGQEAILYVKDVMLEKGSVAHDYEDYPTSPGNPHDIHTVSGDNTLTVRGKNLINNTLSTQTKNDITFTKNSDGSITLNGTASANTTLTLGIVSLKSGKTYTLSGGEDLSTNTVRLDMRLSDAGTIYDNWYIPEYTTKTIANDITLYASIRVQSGASFTNKVIYPMLEEGSTAATYAPYKKQEYEINLGKNLYNKNTMPLIHGLWYGSGAITSNNAGNVVIVPITGGKTYTISKKNNGGDYRLYTTTTATYPAAGVSVIDTWAGGDTTTKTLTTNINAKYLFIALLAKGSPSEEEQVGAIEELQVEEGPTATEYAPYFEPIELCKIGDYQDKIFKNTGSNLYNPIINEGTYRDATYTIASDGKITQSATDNSNWQISDSRNFQLPAGTYTIKIIGKSSDTNAQLRNLTDNTDVFVNKNDVNTFTLTSTKTLGFKTYSGTATYPQSYYIMLSKGSTATEYEPYGVKGKWYLHKEIGKVVLDGSETWNRVNSIYCFYANNILPNVKLPVNNNTMPLMYCSHFKVDTYNNVWNASGVDNSIAINNDNTSNPRIHMSSITDKDDFKTWLSTHNTTVYYVLNEATNTEITDTTLLNQLNYLNQNAITYDGDTYITVDTVNEKPSLNLTITDINQNSTTQTGKDINVVGHEYAESAIRIYDNPLTHNELLRKIALNGCERLFGITYTPLTINTIGHPWLEGDSYVKLEDINERTLYTYPFNRKLTYKGYINSTITSIAENQIKQTYEYSKNMLYKITKTEIDVDKANNRITLLNKDVEDNYTKQSTFETTVSDITSTVKTIDDRTSENGPIVQQISQVQQSVNAIQNLFQITGGTNLIKNSAFLLNDDVWEFTNIGSGTHYHTPLGQGYNGSVIGSVVSKSQVQLKNIKMSSKIDSDNIQVSLLNTQHSFTYAYKMDANTTATIKLIDTTTNTAVYEETLTPTNTITKMQFPPKPAEGEEQQIFTPTAINYKLEVETQTTQDGSVYLYDMMFNSGDFKPWEPSSGEITSTILKLSMLGLQVISTGSNVATVMNASGFAVYPIDSSGNIGANPITSFNNVGLITGEAETTKVTIEKYVMDELQLDGVEHHVEYFKE